MADVIQPGKYRLKEFVETPSGLAHYIAVNSEQDAYLMGQYNRLMQERGVNGEPKRVPRYPDEELKDRQGQRVLLPENWRDLLGERIDDVAE